MNKKLFIVMFVLLFVGITFLAVPAASAQGADPCNAASFDVAKCLQKIADSLSALTVRVEKLEKGSVAPTAMPTAKPTAVATAQPATDRIKRLIDLDVVYRNQGLLPWLSKAGFTWSDTVQQARQVEEETVQFGGLPKIVASGVQLKATNFHAAYPSCFTTDRPFVLDTNGRSFKPDANNPSVLVTNGVVSDTLTAYVDCSNWGQLAP